MVVLPNPKKPLFTGKIKGFEKTQKYIYPHFTLIIFLNYIFFYLDLGNYPHRNEERNST